ncbi:MAG: DUF2877 domain-containing protein [Anaerolineae bacterium]
MIAARTVAEPVIAWLQAGPRRLRVQSAFPHAINVVGDDEQFLTLLVEDADDGPFALRLALNSLPSVPAGTVACADHGTLAVGPLVIAWQSAARWNPILKPLDKGFDSPFAAPDRLCETGSIVARALLALSPLIPICVNLSRERRSSSGFSRVSRPSGLPRTRSLGLDTPSATRPAVASALKLTRMPLIPPSQPFDWAQDRLWERGEPGSPPPLPPQSWGGGEGLGEGATPSAFHVRLAIQAATHLATLRAGLQGDDTALTTAVRALLGFGEGLTPAGDDCLLGVLAARRMLGRPAGALEDTIRRSVSRTTVLSAAFLRTACDGQFAGHWHRLRDALDGGDAAEIAGAVRHILAHGATSGADALVGWVVGVAGFE